MAQLHIFERKSRNLCGEIVIQNANRLIVQGINLDSRRNAYSNCVVTQN